MELLDDDGVETMVALYCPLGRLNTEPIQLFAELEDAEPVEIITHLSQQYGLEDLRTEVPRLSVYEFDIDLNVGCSNQVADSKLTIYVGECWKLTEGCKWRDHRKLDSKTIYNCILAMVKDDPTITVSVLITKMQKQFHY
ncbi:hypothetical protein GOBAR_DD19342 [Gossypium barbadense]|nr:hypothetical protein GOBAR_DD19342 [Gossypium barbadense]